MSTPTPKRPRHAPSPAVSRALLERVILLVVVGGSLVTIWYGVARFRALQARTITLQQQLARLQADIDLMGSRWPAVRSEAVQRRFAEIPEHLFKGNADLQAWIESTHQAAPPLALDARVSVTDTRSETNAVGIMTVVRARVDFPPTTDVEATRPVYQRLVEFAQHLASHPQRIDFLETHIAGSDIGITSAAAIVDVWTTEPLPAPPLAAATP